MRRRLDFYETPPHYVAALLHYTQPYGVVYEPCAGEGAISDALESRVDTVVTNDLDKKRPTHYHYDARNAIPPDKFDWIITNPPFSSEMDILDMSFSRADNIAFLARLSFLEPTDDRSYFLEQHPPSLVIVLPRYSFRPNDEGKRQTDSVTCCWLVWRKQLQVPLGTFSMSKGRSMALAKLMDL